MSQCKTSFPPVPAKTKQLVKECYGKKKNLYVELDRLLEAAYKNFDFSDLYALVGRPGIHPQILLRATFVQYVERLTDRGLTEAVRDRNSLKYFFHQPLNYSGFDPSVLSDFRNRLLKCDCRDVVLQPMLDAAKQIGLLKHDKQRTDSTHVLMAARELNQLELASETLRFAMEYLAEQDFEWLNSIAKPHWRERYSVQCFNFRIPKKEKEKTQWIRQLAEDGQYLLVAVDQRSEESISSSFEITTLREVWRQQFIFENDDVGRGRFRKEKEYVVSAKELIVSPQDVDARLGSKREVSHKGYKTHLTETFDPEAPHLITNVETTDATVPDLVLRRKIEQRLEKQTLMPKEHVVDSGYTDVKSILESRNSSIDVVGPMRAPTHWQSKAGKGFDLSHFKIDFDELKVECPQGKVSRTWSPRPKEDSIFVRFPEKDCRTCPVHADCTKAKGSRTLMFKVQEQFELLTDLRKRECTDDFKQRFAKRAGVEGTISQAVRRTGLRRSRYFGLEKTHLHSVLSAAALNLIRVFNWFMEMPQAQTRISQLSHLQLVQSKAS